MTIILTIGRRTHRTFVNRKWSPSLVVSVQENLWNHIANILNNYIKSNRKRQNFAVTLVKNKNREDLNFDTQWFKLVIMASKEEEEEEYTTLSTIFCKFKTMISKQSDITNTSEEKWLKSNFVEEAQLEDAYKNDYCCGDDHELSQKVKKMGIITLLEWHEDYVTRV